MAAMDEDTKSKVLRQVEFYFSDSNLPKDKFLKGEVEKHPNGFVDLSLIMSFARMRGLLKLPEKTAADSVPDELIQAVAEVLRGSSQLQVAESGYQVKRAAPLPGPGEAAKAVDQRSIYARPFPMDATIDDVSAFFERSVGPVNCVRFRRHARSKDFKGSVMVEFTDEETAKKALSQPLTYEGAPMRLEAKMIYMRRKMAERKAKGEAHKITLKMLEEADSEPDIAFLSEINASAGPAKPSAKRPREEAGGGEGEQQQGKGDARETGCLVRVEWSEVPEDMTGYKLRGALGGRDAQVRFVEYNAGSTTAIVRFEHAAAAEKALADHSAKPEEEQQLAGGRATLAAVEGDEEKEYYDRADVAAANKQQQHGPRGGGRGGRGGGRGGRGRGGRGGRGRGRGRG